LVDSGKPNVAIEGEENESLFLELQIAKCHVSITHERDYTIATAMVEESQWMDCKTELIYQQSIYLWIKKIDYN